MAGCGGPQGPPDPLQYLQIGVEPAAETDAVADNLAEAGYELERRIDGRTFSALSAHRPDDGATAVRVITRRGIAMALDGPTETVDAIGLVPAASDSPLHDLDGDGLEEIAVVSHDRVRARRCLRLLRIRDDARVVPVALENEGVPPDACVEALEDVGGDPRAEALVVVRHRDLARTVVPSVTVPFAGRDGEWALSRGEPQDPYWRDAIAARRRELEAARAALDVESSYRLAVELASLLHFRGRSATEQVRAFDDALRGLVLAPSQAEAVGAARGHIAAGWPD